MLGSMIRARMHSTHSAVLPVRGLLALAAALLTLAFGTPAAAADLPVKSIAIGHGIRLHYVEQGRGPPLIFIHGSLSDYTYWDDQVTAFATAYHVIAYSRRYNFPNRNPPRPGYSAVTDAEDLAAFIEKRHLGKVFLVGHSYGALTALFLSARHPQRVRAAVLAEPPAVSLLRDLPPDQAVLLPNSRRVVFDRSGHQMWLQQPQDCREAAAKFLSASGGPTL